MFNETYVLRQHALNNAVAQDRKRASPKKFPTYCSSIRPNMTQVAMTQIATLLYGISIHRHYFESRYSLVST